jgi:hypothetical protein
MDLAGVNAFGRPVVQPTTASREALGLRPVADPREAQIPASPLAARNPADLRQANGPRQSSSASEARNDGEPSQVRARGGHRSRPALEDGEAGERGASIDVTV